MTPLVRLECRNIWDIIVENLMLGVLTASLLLERNGSLQTLIVTRFLSNKVIFVLLFFFVSDDPYLISIETSVTVLVSIIGTFTHLGTRLELLSSI